MFDTTMFQMKFAAENLRAARQISGELEGLKKQMKLFAALRK
jgi:hypothetical protein